MPAGGKRQGAGRPRKSPATVVVDLGDKKFNKPEEFWKALMNSNTAPLSERMEAARALAELQEGIFN